VEVLFRVEAQTAEFEQELFGGTVGRVLVGTVHCNEDVDKVNGYEWILVCFGRLYPCALRTANVTIGNILDER